METPVGVRPRGDSRIANPRRRLNIVAVLPAYPPDYLVGAWLSTHECLKALMQQGHNVRVFAKYVKQSYEYEGISVKHLREADWQELAEWADRLITHEGDKRSVPRAFFRAKTPHVLMYHGGSTNLRLRSNAALVVFNSKASQADSGSVPSIVLHPPIWPSEFKRSTKGRFITLINSSHAKGIETFQQIAKRMSKRRFLSVAGFYATQKKLRMRNVRSIPATRDIKQVYANTRILLMPSLRETYGRTGVEAMSCGIPVIAHPTPGLREALGEAGIFVNRNDIDSWVQEIKRLDDPDEYNDAAEAALKQVGTLNTDSEMKEFVSAAENLDKDVEYAG